MIQFLDNQLTMITISSSNEGQLSSEMGSNSHTHQNTSIVSGNTAMRRLHSACKILTLDAPADIRRYQFLFENMSLFAQGEEEIRLVLGRRVDFSKDAVKNVKLQL